MSQPHAIVIVLGLTSALELRKKGIRVTILARDLPSDIYSQSFASPWAGANWCSFAVNDLDMRRREEYTFKEFAKLAKELGPDIVAFMPFVQMHDKPNDYDTFWYGKCCGGMRMVENHPLARPEAPYAYEFRSLCLSVPNYTKWLVAKLQGEMPEPAGPPVKFARVTTLESLEAAAHMVRGVSFIVNATGLGSQDLGDVKDKSVYPIRGQTVLVNAPRFRDPNVARCVNFMNGSQTVYVIPRALTGHVILGGTFDANVSNPMLPDPKVTERILKDAVACVPELLPEGVDPKDPEAWRKVSIVRVNIGIRPARKGGARVELDSVPVKVGGRPVGVIHAYGIGPAGYQTSYGIAAEVVDLAEQWLARGRARGRARL
ncbi:D-amino-acid oxidase [Malassezia cuniculi]|uniref:D-amino-acid oxidase n=1 Tax=Malassezia cuniculi TaxID=948313 RepID=A0AAF0J612_9BASI|nr:D-amino-acid oxidase [Malassezia cuniculi]